MPTFPGVYELTATVATRGAVSRLYTDCPTVGMSRSAAKKQSNDENVTFRASTLIQNNNKIYILQLMHAIWYSIIDNQLSPNEQGYLNVQVGSTINVPAKTSETHKRLQGEFKFR